MFTLLRDGYSLSLQQHQNVALVPMSFDLHRGEFALHAESAGHYVIALHLTNPQHVSYAFHNKLQRIKVTHPLPPTVTTLVEQQQTIESGATFVVPCLLQLDAGEWAGLIWYLQGGNVLFHALTVDKLG
jgi:Cu/Ag efflux pump CusA